MDTQPNDSNQNKDNYSEYKNLLDQYASNNTDTSEPTNTPPEELKLPEGKPVLNLPPVPNYPQKTPDSSNIFKYIFFGSLIIFLVVYSFIGFSLIKKPSTTITNTDAANQTAPVLPSPTLTPVSTQICALNDKNYEVGESFTAADGCNVCTCSADLSISCTEKVCPAAKPTIKTSTQSAKKTGN